MDTPRENHARLDAYIQARADERNIDLKQIAADLGIAPATLIGWRKGYQTPMRAMAKRLDRWMGWREEPSSTLALLLYGKDPMPAGSDESKQGAEVASVIAEIESLPNLSPEQKHVLISTLRATVQATRDQARRMSEEQTHRNAS